MPRLAVLGMPIAHSRSPAMQGAALAALGLGEEWSYEAIEVAPEDFRERVAAMPGEGFAGANVTVPHKVAALALADTASEAAREIGAANTLNFGAAGIAAENTDAPGLLDALPAAPAGARALVLGAGGSARACAWALRGAGGSARACAWALRGAGAEVSIWNRTAERGRALAATLGVGTAELDPAAASIDSGDYDLIVNTTTVGLDRASSPDPPADAIADLKPLPLDADSLGVEHVVVDLVYGAAPTPLVALARERGATVVDGLEILVRQGARSLRIWTGQDPPLDVMRDAARNAR